MEPALFLKQHSDELVRYASMITAIAECEQFDEVKDLRDKAHIIEVYAAQALNFEAEQKAARIRLRAEKRCGQLLKESRHEGTRDMPGGDRTSIVGRSDHAPTLAELGVSKQHSSDWQKLADVPEEVFEAKLNDPNTIPSTAGLIERPKVNWAVSSDDLFVWGRIMDFEREGCLKRDPHEVFAGMLDTMQEDIVRIVPQLVPWLTELIGGSHEGKLLRDESVA